MERTTIPEGGKEGRPLALVVFVAVLAAAAAAFLAMGESQLAGHAARLLALCAALALWIGEAVPRGPSALLLLVFVDLLGLSPTGYTFAGFAEPSFFFLFAVLFISTAIGLAGTTTRVAHRLLESGSAGSKGGIVWQLPLFMLGSAALVSSATARVSLMHPVLEDLVESTGAKPGLRRYLTLFVANLNPLTSRAFLSGGPGIVVAAELMSRAGHDMGWGAWVLWMGVPVAIIFALSTVGHWLWLRPGRLPVVARKNVPFSRRDAQVGVVVLAVVLMWIFGPLVGIGGAGAALLGVAVLAFLPGGGEVVQKVDWDLVLFAGATLSFAGILLETGTAAWLGNALFAPLQQIDSQYLASLLVFVVLVLLRLPLSSGVSYSAMVFPIILSLGDIGGLESLHISFMALVAGGVVLLPFQSNPTIISFSSGQYRLSDAVVSGLLTVVAAIVVFLWVAIPYWRWLAG